MKSVATPSTMRISRYLAILLIPVAMLSSCNKDDDNNENTQAISEEEAAEVITKSVEEDAGGITIQVEAMVLLTAINTNSEDCGITKTETYSKSSSGGAAITYDYSFNWEWILQCNAQDEPTSINYSFNGSAMYDAPRMASDDAVSSTIEVTGLEPASEVYIFNQSYYRDGSQQSKIRDKRSFESEIILETDDLVVDKTTHAIESGSIAVSISGKVSSGGTFAYAGNIIFHGDGQATLTLQSGANYNIDL